MAQLPASKGHERPVPGEGPRLAHTFPSSVLPVLAPARPLSIPEAPQHQHGAPALSGGEMEAKETELTRATRMKGLPSPCATSQDGVLLFQELFYPDLRGNVQDF